MRLILFTFLITIGVMSMSYAVQGPSKIHRICNSNAGNTIYWQNMPDNCGSFQHIVIYRKRAGMNDYVAIDTIEDYLQMNQYLDTDGDRTDSYYLSIYYNCDMDEAYISDSVNVNTSRPAITPFDSVSVVNNNLYMGWRPPQNDVWGYIIYYVDGDGTNRILDTVWGRDNSFFIDSLMGDPNDGVETYRMAAFDSCGNISPISNAHRTVSLDYEIDACDELFTLNWTAYQGWDNGVGSYQIFVRMNDTTTEYVFYDEVSAQNLSYPFENLISGNEYCFYVRTKSQNASFTSTSNRICIDVEFVERPDEVYLKSVTVSDRYNLLNWHISDYSVVSEIVILRGNNKNNVDSYVRFTNPANFPDTYLDSRTNTNDSVYHYRIQIVDNCGLKPSPSNPGNNILLNVEERGIERTLDWNIYEYWMNEVDAYRIYRTNTTTDPFVWTMIDEVEPTNDYYLKYTDDEILEDFGNRGICYYVEAIEERGNTLGFRGLSKSNIYCMDGDPVVFVPNSFAPLGVNRIFKVDGHFIDEERFSLKIFDRWGSLVFETNDINEGWDGRRNNGEVYDSGIYLYKIEVTGFNDTQESLSGTLNLF
jgi:gliding motility-associated-like protein